MLAACGGGSREGGSERFLKIYLVTMAALAWMAVLTGTYIVYPWYRAVPPPGTTSLSDFPQRLLQSSPSTAAWHSLGMEWKEHVAWLVPISITMAAVVLIRYGGNLRNHAYLRKVVLCFVAVSFLAAGVAGFFGAMLNKNAPVRGGATIRYHAGKAAMTMTQDLSRAELPNGPGAAAILAAGIGCFALGVLAVVADRVVSFGRMMIFYRPTGPLSGVTTSAVLVWLFAWAVLEWRWRKKTVNSGRIAAAALVLLGLGLLLTFPPFADLL